MDEGSSGLEGLPYELVWCVMVHLPVRDLLLGLGLTARRFHRIAAVEVKGKPTEEPEEDEPAKRGREETTSDTTNDNSNGQKSDTVIDTDRVQQGKDETEEYSLSTNTEELWRQYALHWRLWSDEQRQPESWFAHCRQELEKWCFTTDLDHIVEASKLHVGQSAELSSWVKQAQRAGSQRESLIVIDPEGRSAELLIRGGSFSAAMVLIKRPIGHDGEAKIKFKVVRQTGFWMVGVIGAVPERYPRSERYMNMRKSVASLNVNGSLLMPEPTRAVKSSNEVMRAYEGSGEGQFREGSVIEVHLLGTIVRFFIDGVYVYGKERIDIKNLPRPWHFFWAADGHESKVEIMD